MKTRDKIEIVDAEALRQALESMCDYVNISYENELLYFTTTRYATNANGYHVGYERFTGELKLYNKSEFRVHSMSPYALSGYFVVPDALSVASIEPAEQLKEYTKEEALEFLIEHNKWSSWIPNYVNLLDHYADDELLQEAYDRGMGEGDYFPPDDDFAYEELNHALNEALDCLPAATFDPNTRTWHLGSLEWKIPS